MTVISSPAMERLLARVQSKNGFGDNNNQLKGGARQLWIEKMHRKELFVQLPVHNQNPYNIHSAICVRFTEMGDILGSLPFRIFHFRPNWIMRAYTEQFLLLLFIRCEIVVNYTNNLRGKKRFSCVLAEEKHAVCFILSISKDGHRVGVTRI